MKNSYGVKRKDVIVCPLVTVTLNSFIRGFLPINLCLVLYKLVMKVITNQFKVIFSNIISLEQVGFVIGRNIVDNIIITQEVVHSMRSKQQSQQWMFIKIDLEKAYDQVRWKFIEASLWATSIPNLICNVIMSAITSSSMQILWNGVLTQKF